MRLVIKTNSGKNKMAMIDIHTHLLPSVDDGSASLEQSLKMLSEEVKQGITDIIITPHYRFGYNMEESGLKKEFEKFKSAVLDAGIQVNLYLGQEIYYDQDTKRRLLNGELLTLADSKYVLLEFSFGTYVDIAEVVYEFKREGYEPIVAHFERYGYADQELASEIRQTGGYVQVNASSIVGKKNRPYKRFVKKLFKAGLVDFVASDFHSFRENEMQSSYKKIEKKFVADVAEKVFNLNAQKIIKG